ncbi:MAG: GNAT family N-acetyltransferase [Acidimicrobiales bacterium]
MTDTLTPVRKAGPGWHGTSACGTWRGYSFFAAILKSNERFIGWVWLDKVMNDPELTGTTEIGWFIDRRHWGEGLATEGAKGSRDFGFRTLGLDRIIARYQTDNVASRRVMEKIGMRYWKEIPHLQLSGTTTVMFEMTPGDLSENVE